MAPTIVVARISLTSPNNTIPSTHISVIQFHTHSATGQSEGQQDNICVDDVGDSGKADGEKKAVVEGAC